MSEKISLDSSEYGYILYTDKGGVWLTLLGVGS